MPNILKPKIVVLWEHELRAAAKSLAPFAGGGKDVSADDCRKMLNACFAALYSPELADDDCPVTVMSCKETMMITKTEVRG
jgi:hypothetical protein